LLWDSNRTGEQRRLLTKAANTEGSNMQDHEWLLCARSDLSFFDRASCASPERRSPKWRFVRLAGATWIASQACKSRIQELSPAPDTWRNGDRSSVLHRTKRCSPKANTACPSQAHMPYSIFSSPLARSAMTMPSAGKYSFSSLADERCPSIRKPSFNGRVSFALAALSRLS
jgi:hypothetical protein